MSFKVSIWTSADGLCDIPVAEYEAEVRRQIAALAYDVVEVDLHVSEHTSGKTRVALTRRKVRMNYELESDLERAIREIVTVSAFEACCAA